MNRRVLVIEPDPAVRRMIELALTAAGLVPTSVLSVEASRAIMDAQPIDVAIVELTATNAEGTDGVGAFRRDYPSLPIVVTGALVTSSVAQDLVRIRVDDILPKPFTPRELVAAVKRVLNDESSRFSGAMEYAAAMAAARRAIVDGRLSDTAPLLRARAVSPLDGESMALLALVHELAGDNEAASRAYRAALALGAGGVTDDAAPADGLARLSAYRGARPVPGVDKAGRHVLWFVGDPIGELTAGIPGDRAPDVIVFALGLDSSEVGATYARVGDAPPAFLICTSPLTPRLAARVARSFDQPILLGSSLSINRDDRGGEGGGGGQT